MSLNFRTCEAAGRWGTGGRVPGAARRGRRRAASGCLAVLFSAMAAAGVARAHIVPVGVGLQSYLTIEPGRIAVEYNLGWSALAGYEEVLRMEANRDGILSKEEIRAWLDRMQPRVLAGLELTLDGKPVVLELTDRKSFQLFAGTDVRTLDGAPFDTWWSFKAEVEIGPGEHTVRIRDRNYENEISQALIWLPKPKGATFRTYAFETEPPGATIEDRGTDWMIWARAATLYLEFMPRAYADLAALGAALAPPTSGAVATAGPGGPVPLPPPTSAGMRRYAEASARELGIGYRSSEEEELSALVALRGRVWYAALGLALLWGAAHALAPGHGKSMVAAYLLGTEGRVRDAVALGGIVTLTHTASIYLMAVGTYLLAERVFGVSKATASGYGAIFIEVGSGLAVCLIGVGMFARRLRRYCRGEVLEEHAHGPGGHVHVHEGVAHHAHEVAANHAHAHPGTETRRGLIPLGLAAGLQPCTAGVALVLMSLAQGWIWTGLYLVLAFSIGLGLVLVAIAVAIVVGRSYLARRVDVKESRLVRLLPLVSAALLAAVGLYMAIDVLAKNRIYPFS